MAWFEVGLGGAGVLTINEPDAASRSSLLVMLDLTVRVDLFRYFFVGPRLKYYAYLDGTGTNFAGAEVFVGINFFD